MRRATILFTSLRGQLVRATGRNAAETFARLPRLEGRDSRNAHFPGSRSATVADAPVERGREFVAGGGGQLAQGLAVKRARPRRTLETHLPRRSVKLPKREIRRGGAHSRQGVGALLRGGRSAIRRRNRGTGGARGVDCPGEAAACRLRRLRSGAPLLPASHRDVAETRSSLLCEAAKQQVPAPLRCGPFQRPERRAFGQRMRHSALHRSAGRGRKPPNSAVDICG
ncbi:uncharacterized protein Tco025E_09688 [Trypanosoma conorhini]|uniref:Uncharacterized protein n=1 Tax=Trypanosoma conorhini TaxID=83891 RepID=A0A422MTW5_9TRYP|nr:uncharacterized protein Tco025E_09688 [Trypanosoma conorhini]RNE96670.1 hypothetical protein Tco025E_09688 [Trypanosoma conorhini]